MFSCLRLPSNIHGSQFSTVVLGDPNCVGSSSLGFLFLSSSSMQTHQSFVGRHYKSECEMHIIYFHYPWRGRGIRCLRHMDLASPNPRTVLAGIESKQEDTTRIDVQYWNIVSVDIWEFSRLGLTSSPALALQASYA